MTQPERNDPRDDSRAHSAAQRREARRRRWTILALLFPLFFFLVIAFGLATMYFRQMEFFRPARVGMHPGPPPALALAGPAATT